LEIFDINVASTSDKFIHLCFWNAQTLRVDLFDEDLLPGTTVDDDDLLGRVEVNLEGELSIDTPIQKWVTLTDLGEVSVQPHDFQTSAHSLCLLKVEKKLACLLTFIGQEGLDQSAAYS